jgi:hypothetical protein
LAPTPISRNSQKYKLNRFHPSIHDRQSSSLTFNGNITCNNGSSGKTMFLGGVGTNTINGALQNGSQQARLQVSGGTWVLTNTNTYNGVTTIATNGSLVVNGSIGVGAVTVQSGGKMSGNGTVLGATTVQAGGTLAPGTSVGTLTISNNLSLAGTAGMEIARNGAVLTKDQVVGINTLTYGGTLVVTNIGGSPLQVGDSFQLFAATSYAGAFASIVYPAGYTFTDNLATSGTITVLTAPVTTPPTLTYVPSGGNWVFTWVGGGFKLQTQTNILTVGLGTNWVDVAGGNTSGVSVPAPIAGNPAVFFRLISTL